MEQIKKLNREPIGEKNCIGGNSHGMAREPIGDDLEFPREFSNPKYQLSSSKKFWRFGIARGIWLMPFDNANR